MTAVLDDLLEWFEYWCSTNPGKPFNWYGAVQALKVMKDPQLPYVKLAELQDNKGDKTID